MTVRDIVDEVRKLPRNEQVDILDHIYCLLNTTPESVALTSAQTLDFERRLQEYRSGKAKMIPGDEAIAELRERANARLRAE